MTRNMHMLISKNPHYVGNKPLPAFLQDRFWKILHNKTTPEDKCPFDLCCDDCKYFSKDFGCSLKYREGGA